LKPLLGIDFGTSHAAAAIAVGGKVAVVPLEGGQPTMPALVGFPLGVGGGTPGPGSDRPLVGAAARLVAARHPERVVNAVKRLLGRKFVAPEVRRHRQDVAYEIVSAKNGDARVRVGRRHYAPPDVAAYVLESLKSAAERLIGQPIADAVLAVPAYFNDLQRQAMRDAARIAGLEVRGVITEPAAAALGAGILPVPARTERKVLVYDLGGGSFDVVALAVSDDEAAVVASGGDAFLGGEDFDQRVATYISDEIQRAGGGDPRRHPALFTQIKAAAEEAKRTLSNVDETEIRVDALGVLARRGRAVAGVVGGGGVGGEGAGARARQPAGAAIIERPGLGGSGQPLSVPLSRARLEALTQDLVDRTVWPCETVLRDAGWTMEDVDAFLLVGGQTRMPRLSAQLREMLGRAPLETPSPETLVALGAARQGAALLGGPRSRAAALTEVTCRSLGVETAGGLFTRLVPKGTRLPATRSQPFSTATDGQTQIVIHVFQGEREMAADNESLARLAIGPLPPRPRGVAAFEVTLETDGGGLPRVSARDIRTGEARPVRLRPSGGLTEAEIAALTAVHAGRPLPAGLAADGERGPGTGGGPLDDADLGDLGDPTTLPPGN
jgi:molecular chaperone DnaK